MISDMYDNVMKTEDIMKMNNVRVTLSMELINMINIDGNHNYSIKHKQMENNDLIFSSSSKYHEWNWMDLMLMIVIQWQVFGACHSMLLIWFYFRISSKEEIWLWRRRILYFDKSYHWDYQWIYHQCQLFMH